MKSELQKMRDIFDAQIRASEGTGELIQDWPPLRYDVQPGRGAAERTANTLRLLDLEVGFTFDAEGRLIGAYNWKE